MKKIKSTQTPRQISTQTVSQTKPSSTNHHHNHQQFHLPTKKIVKNTILLLSKQKMERLMGKELLLRKRKDKLEKKTFG